MSNDKAKSSRRAFFLHGGAALGAGVAAAGATGLVADPEPSHTEQLRQLKQQLGSLDDREAIRQLHLTFASAMENQAYEVAADLFAENAQISLSGLTALGRPAIVRLFAQQYRQQQATSLHTAYRQNATQRQDGVTLSNDRQRAAATFHHEVQISTPLNADSTVAQMARLQGQMAHQRWESGRFEARYVKLQGRWKIAALNYLPS